MITDFKLFGIEHIISIILPCLIGMAFAAISFRTEDETARKKVRLLFALVIVATRSVRYVMDVIFGVFEWYDLFSLQICHIDLILLVICMIKPGKILFNFVFLIGIPMGLAVALFPGTNHPAPGMPRAMLFIMSHMMLVSGAFYLAIVERMRSTLKHYLYFAGAGNIGILLIYIINKLLRTNFLYIMEAPQGTVISSLDNIFGWPGYILVMDALALILMLVMLLISNLLTGSKTRNLMISR